MGQQQLLLLVLGIVIVGLAVVVGIQAFGENQRKANTDAVTNDAIRIASDAQAWALKPTAFGGGNGSFDNLTLASLGYNVTGDPATYSNQNGSYTAAVTAGDAEADPVVVGNVLISGDASQGQDVSVRVCGTDADDIITAIGAVAGACP